MAESSILAVPQLEEGQDDKHITHNTAISALEAALGNVILPKTGSYTANQWLLTEQQFARGAFIFKASGFGAATDMVTKGEINGNNTQRTFFAWNADTTYNLTVKSDAAGSTVVVPPGYIAYCVQVHDDVTALSMRRVADTIYTNQDVAFFIGGQPDDGVIATGYKVPTGRTFVLADNFAGSVGFCNTNPASTAAFDVLKNGVSIGSISINTSGVFTFSTTGSTDETFAAGDILTIVTPTPQDSTLADVGVTFKGKVLTA